MNSHMNELINRYLDDCGSLAEEFILQQALLSSEATRRLFVSYARLHDAMQQQSQLPMLNTILPKPAKQFRWRQLLFTSGFAVMMVVLLGLWWGNANELNAATELERLIQQSTTLGDRTYFIKNLDAKPEVTEERKPPIDGAILHVRYPDQYVLIRAFEDGRQFITGSDGIKSWAIPPNGNVRVSHDPLRFRGPVPGQQHGIPFADLRTDLLQLRDAYTVTLSPLLEDNQPRLLAIKKSPEYRGPNRVEISYVPESGIIRQIVFDGMPKARGGPNRLLVKLLDQREQAADFFQHQTHHTVDRRVIEED